MYFKLFFLNQERSQRGEAHRDPQPSQGGLLFEKCPDFGELPLPFWAFGSIALGTLEAILNGCEITLDRLGDEDMQGRIRIDEPRLNLEIYWDKPEKLTY